MFKITETYNDYNEVERTEDFWFHLNKAELMEMELGTTGGLGEAINKLVAAQDMPAIIKVFKDLVLKAYGVKSADGKRFMKEDENGRPYYKEFVETEAYSQIFMRLATDADAAAKFVNGIIPAELAKEANKNLALPKTN